MKIKRIVANISTPDIALAQKFYKGVLELETIMDQGWIQTYAGKGKMDIQLSVASQGGSGTPVPDLSIETDDVNEVYKRMVANGFKIEYGPVNEPWGVRRFYVRDPFGKLVNILSHL